MRVEALRKSLRSLGEAPRGRSKPSLESQLQDAQRAAAARSSVVSGQACRRWFGADPDGCKTARLAATCRWCGGHVEPPRRTFCTASCVHQHKLRSLGQYARRCVFRRDRGSCALCGVDAHGAGCAARDAARHAPRKDRLLRAQRALLAVKDWAALASHLRLSPRSGRPMLGSLWQADHVRAVSDGGGLCGMENLRTLCAPCHKTVTRQQAKARALARQGVRVEKPPNSRGRRTASVVVSESSADCEVIDADAFQAGAAGTEKGEPEPRGCTSARRARPRSSTLARRVRPRQTRESTTVRAAVDKQPEPGSHGCALACRPRPRSSMLAGPDGTAGADPLASGSHGCAPATRARPRTSTPQRAAGTEHREPGSHGCAPARRARPRSSTPAREARPRKTCSSTPERLAHPRRDRSSTPAPRPRWRAGSLALGSGHPGQACFRNHGPRAGQFRFPHLVSQGFAIDLS